MKTLVRTLVISISALVACFVIFGGIVLAYAFSSPTIRNNVYVDTVAVGGLTREQAMAKVTEAIASRPQPSVKLVIERTSYPIEADDIDASFDVTSAVQQAYTVGRSINVFSSIVQIVSLAFTTHPVPLEITYDPMKTQQQIATISKLVDKPGYDVRLEITETDVRILTDTQPGYFVDQSTAFREVEKALIQGDRFTPSLALMKSYPTVDAATADEAKTQALRVLDQPLTLSFDRRVFELPAVDLGAWIMSVPNGKRLEVQFDQTAISSYVTTIAKELDAEPQAPKVNVADGKVVDFVLPRSGQRLDQTETIRLIVDALDKRREEREVITKLSLPVRTEKPLVTDGSAAELGITELIGTASTRFTGSPKNRVANIKNGAKFLTGILVKPGEEFSTLAALGTVDNTTGYLPELVIKENRTVPEFGGGLCQVSTTLFRATMNTGLPITARRNHSYRVIYYEKDGTGKFIGPGLDATIYQPAPDFKFRNDTKNHILISGHVEGDKITFDFYGTKDGRTSEIDGPHLLKQTPAGDSIYVEDPSIAPGEQKQIEKPHPGGSAVATYTIAYPDGTEAKNEFKSFYRNWPAQFLVAPGELPVKATTTLETTP